MNVTADDGDNTITQEFTLTVVDVNEAPTDLTINSPTIVEESDGAVAGALTVTDPDDSNESFGQHTYLVDDARFEVSSGGDLQLRTGEVLDHETEATVTLNVTADDGDNTITREFTLTVVDVNEAPTDLTIDSLTVDEEADGAVVGTLTVTDPDDSSEPFGQHTFSVDDVRFEVSSGGDLQLRTGETLDHETESTVTLNVTADDGDNTITREFTLTVVDVNEAPTDLTIDSLTVDEEADGAVVGTLTVTDPDDSNEPFGQHTFSVDDARFEVSSGGDLQLRTGETLDHETESTVTLNVTADDGDNTITREFTLTVVDVNEAPTDLTIDSVTVDEEADGAVVGTLTVTDPDDSNEPFGQHTFSVDDVRFEVSSGGDLQLRTGETLDHETESTVTLNVTADDGDNTITREFTLTVVDVNEAPTDLTIDSLTVDEEADGAVVGTLTVTDPDDSSEAFGQHTYSVDDARFEVSSGGDLQLKTGETLDHETESSITLNVTADDGDHTITRQFTLTVVDVNESPTDLTIDSLTINEETDGAVVGTLTVTDPDDSSEAFGQHAFSVDDARFEVTAGGVLQLQAGQTLDHETESSITLNVTADDGDNTITRQFTLTVVDLNESPTDLTIDSLDVDEEADGAAVGTLTVSDPDDSGESFGQHAFSVDDARFEVTSGGVLQLQAGQTLDHETESSITLNVTADDGDNTITRQFTLTVVDVNESPTDVTIDNTSVTEGVAGATIGTITVTDPDDSSEPFGQHTFVVSDARFEVVSGELQLVAGTSLDHESEATLTIDVTADDGDNQLTRQFTLTVVDVNEAPTDITLDNLTLTEEVDGAVVGDVSVVDPDDASEPFGQHSLVVSDARFEIVSGQLKLRSGETLDHESVASVTLDVTADDGLNSRTQQFTISVVDVNEAPTALTIDSLTVVEGVGRRRRRRPFGHRPGRRVPSPSDSTRFRSTTLALKSTPAISSFAMARRSTTKPRRP